MARSFGSGGATTDALVNLNGPTFTPPPITVAVWFNPTVDGGELMHAGHSPGISSGTQYRMYLSAGNKVTCDTRQGGIGDTAVATNNTFVLGTWNHAAAVFNSTTNLVYLNGDSANKGSTACSTNNTAATGVVLGNLFFMGDGTGWYNGYSGALADAAIWSVQLTDAEILALSKGARPHTIRPGSLIYYSPVNGIQMPEPDLSGNADNLLYPNKFLWTANASTVATASVQPASKFPLVPVLVDAVGTFNFTAASVTTASNTGITVGSGSNRALVFAVTWGGPTSFPSSRSVVWDAGGTNQTMTELAFFGNTGGNSTSVGLYGLVAPTSGNKTCTATWTTGCECYMAGISFTNVSQSVPFISASAGFSGGVLLRTLSQGGAILVGAATSQAGAISGGTGTSIFSSSAGFYSEGAAQYQNAISDLFAAFGPPIAQYTPRWPQKFNVSGGAVQLMLNSQQLVFM